MVKRFLGEPDIIAPNPYYTSGSPMQLYEPVRVEAAERTPEFCTAHLDALAASLRRSHRSAG